MKIRNSYTDKTNFDWQRNVVLTLFTLPMGAAIVYFYGDMFSDFDVMIVGYTLDSILKNTENFSWKKIGK
jgi:hypothetical protein